MQLEPMRRGVNLMGLVIEARKGMDIDEKRSIWPGFVWGFCAMGAWLRWRGAVESAESGGEL